MNEIKICNNFDETTQEKLKWFLKSFIQELNSFCVIIMRKFWRDTVHNSKHSWCVVMYLIYYSVKRAVYHFILYLFPYLFVCSYKWCPKSTENTNLNTGIIKIIHTSTSGCAYISIYTNNYSKLIFTKMIWNVYTNSGYLQQMLSSLIIYIYNPYETR